MARILSALVFLILSAGISNRFTLQHGVFMEFRGNSTFLPGVRQLPMRSSNAALPRDEVPCARLLMALTEAETASVRSAAEQQEPRRRLVADMVQPEQEFPLELRLLLPLQTAPGIGERGLTVAVENVTGNLFDPAWQLSDLFPTSLAWKLLPVDVFGVPRAGRRAGNQSLTSTSLQSMSSGGNLTARGLDTLVSSLMRHLGADLRTEGFATVELLHEDGESVRRRDGRAVVTDSGALLQGEDVVNLEGIVDSESGVTSWLWTSLESSSRNKPVAAKFRGKYLSVGVVVSGSVKQARSNFEPNVRFDYRSVETDEELVRRALGSDIVGASDGSCVPLPTFPESNSGKSANAEDSAGLQDDGNPRIAGYGHLWFSVNAATKRLDADGESGVEDADGHTVRGCMIYGLVGEGDSMDGERLGLLGLMRSLAEAFRAGTLAEDRRAAIARGDALPTVSIFTDCRSLMTSLEHPRNALVDDGMFELTRAVNHVARFARVNFVHVRAHQRISLNEVADGLARRGLALAGKSVGGPVGTKRRKPLLWLRPQRRREEIGNDVAVLASRLAARFGPSPRS